MYVPKYLKLQTISLGFPPNITGSISNVFRLSSEITELFKVNNASSVPLAFFMWIAMHLEHHSQNSNKFTAF